MLVTASPRSLLAGTMFVLLYVVTDAMAAGKSRA
jgi:hypothetical protein